MNRTANEQGRGRMDKRNRSGRGREFHAAADCALRRRSSAASIAAAIFSRASAASSGASAYLRTGGARWRCQCPSIRRRPQSDAAKISRNGLRLSRAPRGVCSIASFPVKATSSSAGAGSSSRDGHAGIPRRRGAINAAATTWTFRVAATRRGDDVDITGRGDAPRRRHGRSGSRRHAAATTWTFR